MQTSKTTITLFALTVLLSTSVLAQQEKGRIGRGIGRPGFVLAAPVMLLGDAGVQKELNLDDLQKEKLTKLNEANRAKFAEILSQLEGLQGEELAKKRSELGKTQGAEPRKAIAEILKPEQAKRLRQIYLQHQGVVALANNAEVQKELNLTDDQKEKMHSMLNADSAKLRELYAGARGNREEAREKLTALRKEQLEKASAILTDDQKKAWKELVGAPFEVQFRRPNN